MLTVLQDIVRMSDLQVAAGMQPLRNATIPRREALLFEVGPRKLLLHLRVGPLYYWVTAMHMQTVLFDTTPRHST